MPTELRVHGVSGTPPSQLLYTDPVSYDQTADLAKVYETNRDIWDVRAYHWGSLTSRNILTSFWILLAPFAMANVAGWMTEKPNVWSRIWIRVSGLALTAIFFAQAANVSLDVLLEIGIDPSLVHAVYVAFCAALIGGLVILTTRTSNGSSGLWDRLRSVYQPSPPSMSSNPENDWSDPAEDSSLTGNEMWSEQSMPHRLRKIHVAFGTAVLATVAARTLENSDLELAAMTTAGLSLIMLGLTAGPMAKWTAVIWATALLPLLSLATLIWVLVELQSLAPGANNVSDDLTFQLALVLIVSAVLAVIGELAATRGRGGLVPLGLLTVATLLGATYGLTAAMLAGTYLPGAGEGQALLTGGAGFVTVGMLGLVAAMAITFVITMVVKGRRREESALRRGVLRSRVTIGAAGVYGLVVGGIAALVSCRGGTCSQSNLVLPEWMQESTEAQVELLGLPFDPGSVVGWAKLLMIAVPAFLILRSIVGGLLNGQDARRKVGIIWDLGSFWPRWFHPLAPPEYGPNAVDSLREQLEADRPDVLSAHSQGSLISALAISQIGADDVPQRFVSYGSQLGDLYPALFPSVGFGDLVTETLTSLDGSWVNLWRSTDPIGGQVIAHIGDRNWLVETGTGHSRYELTPEFCASRKQGLSKPPTDALESCWDSP